MQLQNARQRFEGQGIKLAAISYDSPAILKDFADRHAIDYPLLADPQSKIIASYGVLNPEWTGMMKGMALPGYFYIDATGVILKRSTPTVLPRAGDGYGFPGRSERLHELRTRADLHLRYDSEVSFEDGDLFFYRLQVKNLRRRINRRKKLELRRRSKFQLNRLVALYIGSVDVNVPGKFDLRYQIEPAARSKNAIRLGEL